MYDELYSVIKGHFDGEDSTQVGSKQATEEEEDDDDDFNAGRIEDDKELAEIDVAGPSSPEKQASAKKNFHETLKTITEEEIEETMKAKAAEPVVDRDDFDETFDEGEEEEK